MKRMEETKMQKKVIKVSGKTSVKQLAGSICHSVRQAGVETILQVIGASSLNQAIKASAVARGMLASEGLNLSIIPGFVTLESEGKEVSGIKLIISIQ